jgi:hypothetical protein
MTFATIGKVKSADLTRRGRVGSHRAKQNARRGWGDSLSTWALYETRDLHPTPPLISFASTLPLQGRVREDAYSSPAAKLGTRPNNCACS